MNVIKFLWGYRPFSFSGPLGGSSLLDYITYNYKKNLIKLFTNYSVNIGLMESNYSKTQSFS